MSKQALRDGGTAPGSYIPAQLTSSTFFFAVIELVERKRSYKIDTEGWMGWESYRALRTTGGNLNAQKRSR